MKTTSVWLAAGAVLMLLAASAVAQDEDDSVLWEWSSPSDIQVWAAYEHILRPLDMDHARKADRTLKGNLGAAGIEWSPLGWFSLGAFAGAAEARIDEYMAECGSLGAGGGLSLGANFWQISAEHHRSAWDVTIRAEARASYWQSGDDGEGSVEWFEGFGALPSATACASPPASAASPRRTSIPSPSGPAPPYPSSTANGSAAA